MSFFDKINNYLIGNAIKEILKGRDPEESLSRIANVELWRQIFTAALSSRCQSWS